ncbi:MAG: metallophosphoesterase [Ferruginibacter sp.]|nr:metallophosphoesterase [Bacteroidota bacterium]MBX2918787.1 metallophosphoesterase [Ferruginibacter sp.]MCB0708372.1 metallophosphoesterase [Chitinophagaceae bacterium]MCC7379783.1 metallophosphoesterase [Chitinophagaceae bacterium]
MRTPIGAFIFIAIAFLMDTYIFQAIKTVSQSASPKTRTIIYVIYWSLSVLAIVSFLIFVFTDHNFLGKKFRTYLFATAIGLFLAKMVAIVFLLVDDVRRGIQWFAGKVFFNNPEVNDMASDGISRSAFLSWLGLAASGTLFGSFVYGFGNKYNYQLKRVKLAFDNLPASFKGFKIIHISDIHSGSFTDKKAVLKGVEKILKENADIILFTGDIVNDRAGEMDDYKDVFSRLKAPMGVYSTLGNHDYGDYVHWPYKGISKEQNLEMVKQVHADIGWRLLMNEHVVLQKGDDKIALLGIENWSSKARFPKHGRMDLAYAGTEKYPFKILMSHDPSHWDAQVRPQYADVDLMLSGHTHGMQFGVDIPGFKWSPVQYMYKQWDGLYEEGKQKLYVNPGYGFIGYPGRVGILPEITVIELV